MTPLINLTMLLATNCIPIQLPIEDNSQNALINYAVLETIKVVQNCGSQHLTFLFVFQTSDLRQPPNLTHSKWYF